MIGMFTEVGQFLVVPDDSHGGAGGTTLVRNPGSWAANTSLLFWESPAGVGFSHCTAGAPRKCPRIAEVTPAGLCSNMQP